MNVFVLSLQNKPLMPTTPRRARLWLKAKRARIVSLIPFTIQLRFEPSSLYTQTVKVGVETLSRLYGASQVSTSYGYETKYKRIQVLKLPKTHAHDAIAIACRVGEGVIPNNVCYQIRCLPRGNYQLFNGQRGEHKVSAPKKLYGWKLYEMVEAKGLIGYIGGRRVKGSFALRSPVTGKLFCAVRPSKLRRVCRPQHGWLFIQERIVLPLSAQDGSLRTQ